MASWEQLLPEDLSTALFPVREKITEIRLRVNRPVYVYLGNVEYGIASGRLSHHSERLFSSREAEEVWMRLSQGAPYRHEECQSCGYMTVEGNRVGFAGRYLLKNGQPTFLSVPDSFCIRAAHPVIGCALPVYPFLFENGMPLHSLIVSPPGGGKTTLLRDLCRLLSADGFNVGIADERDELAAVGQDGPAFDVGKRTDVISGVKKSRALSELVRTVRPDVVVVDELGGSEDVKAVREAQTMGVTVFASAHGSSAEAAERLEGCRFRRWVVLDRSCGVGTVKGVYDGHGNRLREAVCC